VGADDEQAAAHAASQRDWMTDIVRISSSVKPPWSRRSPIMHRRVVRLAEVGRQLARAVGGGGGHRRKLATRLSTIWGGWCRIRAPCAHFVDLEPGNQLSAPRQPPGAAPDLDDDGARQLLHVTFGSVLAGELGRELRERLRGELAEPYAAALEAHLARHLRPFA
jgi:site-specific recombinase XerC